MGITGSSLDETNLSSSVMPFTQAQFITEHRGSVRCLDYIDGDRFLSAGDDQLIMVHSFTSGQTLAALKGHKGTINVLYLLTDELFASGSDDTTVKIWKTSDYSYVTTIADHDSPVFDILCLYDRADHFVSVSETKLVVWDLKGTVKLSIPLEGSGRIVAALAIPKDQIVVAQENSSHLTVIALTLSDGTSQQPASFVWKTKKTTSAHGFTRFEMISPSLFAALSLDGSVFVYTNTTIDAKTTLHSSTFIQRAAIVQAAKKSPQKPTPTAPKMPLSPHDAPKPPDSIDNHDLVKRTPSCIHPINEFCCVSSIDNHFFLYKPAIDEIPIISPKHATAAISALTVMFKGDYVASGSQDGSVHIWEIPVNLLGSTGRREEEKAKSKKKNMNSDEIRLIYQSSLHTAPVRTMLPFQTGFVTGSDDGNIILWKIDPTLLIDYDRWDQLDELSRRAESNARATNETGTTFSGDGYSRAHAPEDDESESFETSAHLISGVTQENCEAIHDEIQTLLPFIGSQTESHIAYASILSSYLNSSPTVSPQTVPLCFRLLSYHLHVILASPSFVTTICSVFSAKFFESSMTHPTSLNDLFQNFSLDVDDRILIACALHYSSSESMMRSCDIFLTTLLKEDPSIINRLRHRTRHIFLYTLRNDENIHCERDLHWERTKDPEESGRDSSARTGIHNPSKERLDPSFLKFVSFYPKPLRTICLSIASPENRFTSIKTASAELKNSSNQHPHISTRPSLLMSKWLTTHSGTHYVYKPERKEKDPLLLVTRERLEKGKLLLDVSQTMFTTADKACSSLSLIVGSSQSSHSEHTAQTLGKLLGTIATDIQQRVLALSAPLPSSKLENRGMGFITSLTPPVRKIIKAWNIPLFAQAVFTLYPAIQPDRIIRALDYSGFECTHPTAFFAIQLFFQSLQKVSQAPRSNSSSPFTPSFPYHVLFTVRFSRQKTSKGRFDLWTNRTAQLSLIKAALQCNEDVFSFEEMMLFPDGHSSEFVPHFTTLNSLAELRSLHSFYSQPHIKRSDTYLKVNDTSKSSITSTQHIIDSLPPLLASIFPKSEDQPFNYSTISCKDYTRVLSAFRIIDVTLTILALATPARMSRKKKRTTSHSPSPNLVAQILSLLSLPSFIIPDLFILILSSFFTSSLALSLNPIILTTLAALPLSSCFANESLHVLISTSLTQSCFVTRSSPFSLSSQPGTPTLKTPMMMPQGFSSSSPYCLPSSIAPSLLLLSSAILLAFDSSWGSLITDSSIKTGSIEQILSLNSFSQAASYFTPLSSSYSAPNTNPSAYPWQLTQSNRPRSLLHMHSSTLDGISFILPFSFVLDLLRAARRQKVLQIDNWLDSLIHYLPTSTSLRMFHPQSKEGLLFALTHFLCERQWNMPSGSSFALSFFTLFTSFSHSTPELPPSPSSFLNRIASFIANSGTRYTPAFFDSLIRFTEVVLNTGDDRWETPILSFSLLSIQHTFTPSSVTNPAFNPTFSQTYFRGSLPSSISRPPFALHPSLFSIISLNTSMLEFPTFAYNFLLQNHTDHTILALSEKPVCPPRLHSVKQPIPLSRDLVKRDKENKDKEKLINPIQFGFARTSNQLSASTAGFRLTTQTVLPHTTNHPSSGTSPFPRLVASSPPAEAHTLGITGEDKDRRKLSIPHSASPSFFQTGYETQHIRPTFESFSTFFLSVFHNLSHSIKTVVQAFTDRIHIPSQGFQDSLDAIFQAIGHPQGIEIPHIHLNKQYRQAIEVEYSMHQHESDWVITPFISRYLLIKFIHTNEKNLPQCFYFMKLIDQPPLRQPPLIPQFLKDILVAASSLILTPASIHLHNLDKFQAHPDDPKLVRILGRIIGMSTLAERKAIWIRYLDLKKIILLGYQFGRLSLHIPFVCAVLNTTKNSLIFTLYQPWLISLISLLGEMCLLPIKTSIQYAIQEMYSLLNVPDTKRSNPNDPICQILVKRQKISQDTIASTPMIVHPLTNMDLDQSAIQLLRNQSYSPVDKTSEDFVSFLIQSNFGYVPPKFPISRLDYKLKEMEKFRDLIEGKMNQLRDNLNKRAKQAVEIARNVAVRTQQRDFKFVPVQPSTPIHMNFEKSVMIDEIEQRLLQSGFVFQRTLAVLFVFIMTKMDLSSFIPRVLVDNQSTISDFLRSTSSPVQLGSLSTTSTPNEEEKSQFIERILPQMIQFYTNEAVNAAITYLKERMGAFFVDMLAERDFIRKASLNSKDFYPVYFLDPACISIHWIKLMGTDLIPDWTNEGTSTHLQRIHLNGQSCTTPVEKLLESTAISTSTLFNATVDPLTHAQLTSSAIAPVPPSLECIFNPNKAQTEARLSMRLCRQEVIDLHKSFHVQSMLKAIDFYRQMVKSTTRACTQVCTIFLDQQLIQRDFEQIQRYVREVSKGHETPPLPFIPHPDIKQILALDATQETTQEILMKSLWKPYEVFSNIIFDRCYLDTERLWMRIHRDAYYVQVWLTAAMTKCTTYNKGVTEKLSMEFTHLKKLPIPQMISYKLLNDFNLEAAEKHAESVNTIAEEAVHNLLEGPSPFLLVIPTGDSPLRPYIKEAHENENIVLIPSFIHSYPSFPHVDLPYNSQDSPKIFSSPPITPHLEHIPQSQNELFTTLHMSVLRSMHSVDPLATLNAVSSMCANEGLGIGTAKPDELSIRMSEKALLPKHEAPSGIRGEIKAIDDRPQSSLTHFQSLTGGQQRMWIYQKQFMHISGIISLITEHFLPAKQYLIRTSEQLKHLWTATFPIVESGGEKIFTCVADHAEYLINGFSFICILIHVVTQAETVNQNRTGTKQSNQPPHGRKTPQYDHSILRYSNAIKLVLDEILRDWEIMIQNEEFVKKLLSIPCKLESINLFDKLKIIFVEVKQERRELLNCYLIHDWIQEPSLGSFYSTSSGRSSRDSTDPRSTHSLTNLLMSELSRAVTERNQIPESERQYTMDQAIALCEEVCRNAHISVKPYSHFEGRKALTMFNAVFDVALSDTMRSLSDSTGIDDELTVQMISFQRSLASRALNVIRSPTPDASFEEIPLLQQSFKASASVSFSMFVLFMAEESSSVKRLETPSFFEVIQDAMQELVMRINQSGGKNTSVNLQVFQILFLLTHSLYEKVDPDDVDTSKQCWLQAMLSAYRSLLPSKFPNFLMCFLCLLSSPSIISTLANPLLGDEVQLYFDCLAVALECSCSMWETLSQHQREMIDLAHQTLFSLLSTFIPHILLPASQILLPFIKSERIVTTLTSLLTVPPNDAESPPSELTQHVSPRNPAPNHSLHP
ncbi:putative CCR4-NOT transcription complex subunit 1 CAF1-binding domain containing protein [Blattamonas nauphoetae]|uniref:CCR4-NOT transcription complex subunit 1 CAF1-binding domain containing protein n=1 Tax=Blattamonas nauphoetae TaxID=2049346 RepID=A0ABQ9YF81_9EUKA|nr:putative CCR4-NOT transcription complex subunit 1 CAF1-binding domain containing protein [Blattamonas nauphoetae]